MDEIKPLEHENVFQGHRFIVLIVGSIIISTILVLAALALYVSSGTAQLDLSRPGYAGIRDQVQNNDSFKGYSATGELNDEALQTFDDMYSKKLEDAQSVDAFGNDVLSPQVLQIDNESASKTE